LDYGYSERGPEQPPAATVHSVCEAVQWILNTRSKTD
jgi:hypothetical protein